MGLIGLVVTGALALVSHNQYAHNEQRLLTLRAKEVVAVLAQSIPNSETPLTAAAALAQATAGNPAKFSHFIAPYVGGRGQFATASLWRLGPTGSREVAGLGGTPAVASLPRARTALFVRARRERSLAVLNLLSRSTPELGYAVAIGGPRGYAVYGDRPLPADRRSPLERNTAFSELNYAIFLGPHPTARDLLVTNLSQVAIAGRRSTATLPFGDTVLTLVVTPRVSLGGTLPQRLPWIILGVGIVLALGAAGLTARLVERRLRAEHLAGELELAVRENQELYAEQRTIAQTLQHALLPAELPSIAGTETSARFQAGEQGVDIGGDWYDVIPVDDHRLLTVVGDVSGRGLRAATTMASLRYAIHAYAAQHDPPATILTRLSKLLEIATAGQFATVLCVLTDVRAHEVTVASAGHLPPLLIGEGRGEYLASQVGPPIGVVTGSPYSSITLPVPRRATLLAFTDGLVERRGESIDQGLARLRDAAMAQESDLGELLNRLVRDLGHGYADDDTAIVGLRWTV